MQNENYMGYYNLPPGHQVADRLSLFEQALREIPLECADNTLTVLEKLFKNIAQNPNEQKFRKIKLENEKINAAITSVDAALQALLHMGWELDEDDSLVLPPDVEVTFPQHVVKVLEAKDYFKKEIEKKRAAAGVSRIPNSAAPKSAFSFADKRAQEKLLKDGEDNMARLRQERKDSYALKNARSGKAVPAPSQPVVSQRYAEASPSKSSTGSGSKPVTSEFNFQSRAKRDAHEEKQKSAAEELKALRKAQYKQFQEDPNARNSEAYQKPASLAPGAQDEGSWWNPFSWGGGGSDDRPSRPSGGGGGARSGANIKTVG